MHFLGHVSNEELTALYDVADLFLCASEHEGFCVPIIEAFYKRVPVLAFAATAVPATMDGGGVLYDTKDPAEIARMMDAVLGDRGARGGGGRVAGRGARAARGEGLRRHAAALCRAGPPASATPGARGGLRFLAQFDQFERLEELRQYRPALLYAALPGAAAAR